MNSIEATIRKSMTKGQLSSLRKKGEKKWEGGEHLNNTKHRDFGKIGNFGFLDSSEKL